MGLLNGGLLVRLVLGELISNRYCIVKKQGGRAEEEATILQI